MKMKTNASTLLVALMAFSACEMGHVPPLMRDIMIERAIDKATEKLPPLHDGQCSNISYALEDEEMAEEAVMIMSDTLAEMEKDVANEGIRIFKFPNEYYLAFVYYDCDGPVLDFESIILSKYHASATSIEALKVRAAKDGLRIVTARMGLGQIDKVIFIVSYYDPDKNSATFETVLEASKRDASTMAYINDMENSLLDTYQLDMNQIGHPSAPSSFIATIDPDTRLATLSWIAPAYGPPKFYKFASKYGRQAWINNVGQLNAKLTRAQHFIRDFTPGVTYQFRVYAINHDGKRGHAATTVAIIMD